MILNCPIACYVFIALDSVDNNGFTGTKRCWFTCSYFIMYYWIVESDKWILSCFKMIIQYIVKRSIFLIWNKNKVMLTNNKAQARQSSFHQFDVFVGTDRHLLYIVEEPVLYFWTTLFCMGPLLLWNAPYVLLWDIAHLHQ